MIAATARVAGYADREATFGALACTTPADPPGPRGGSWRGFEPVREAFVETFTLGGELGAACFY